MKITIRTLTQATFTIDVEPSDKILSVKQKIAELQANSPVERQKLIYAGRELSDEKTVESYGIAEGEMIVLLVTRKTTAGTAIKPTEPVVANKPAPSTVQPVAAPSVAPAVGTAAPSAAFPVSDKVVESITEMGFSRDDAVKALQASFGNPDRAVEYLLSGSIPVVEEDGPHGNDATQFGSLANSQQFLESLSMLQQNPELLAAILGQIGERNPELLQAIRANPQAFVRDLQGLAAAGALHPEAGEGLHHDMQESDMHDEEGSEYEGDEHEISREEMQSILERNAAGPGESHNVVHVTPEELEAINRLCALGFDRARATEAYFVCDKNEEVAAAYLFEHMED